MYEIQSRDGGQKFDFMKIFLRLANHPIFKFIIDHKDPNNTFDQQNVVHKVNC